MCNFGVWDLLFWCPWFVILVLRFVILVSEIFILESEICYSGVCDLLICCLRFVVLVSDMCNSGI